MYYVGTAEQRYITLPGEQYTYVCTDNRKDSPVTHIHYKESVIRIYV